jgi:glycerol uptake facilitator-like aquaporin
MFSYPYENGKKNPIYQYRLFLPKMFEQYLAEFLGATFFVYVILATGNPLAIGAALALVILLTSNISGGHINPAVSVVMASFGKLSTSELIPYCLAQIGGALVALEIYKRFRL